MGIYFGNLGGSFGQIGAIAGLVVLYGAMIAYSIFKKAPKAAVAA